VAHHSGAAVEAEERGLLDVLVDEFPITGNRAEHLLNHLTYSDMTIGPAGQRLTVDERIAEILTRYDANDVVHRSITKAAPLLRDQCGWVASQLEGEASGVS
jgi:hypothetical protein